MADACPTCGKPKGRAAITNPGTVHRTPAGLVLDGWGFQGEMSVGGWEMRDLVGIAADLGNLR